MRALGDLRGVGVEGSGSYGAGITRRLAREGIRVLEVTGPEPTSRGARPANSANAASSAATSP